MDLLANNKAAHSTKKSVDSKMAAVGGVAGKKENCDASSEVVSISQTPTETSTITTGADTGLYLQPAMPLESPTQPETVKSFLISSHEHVINDKQCVVPKLKDEVAFFLIEFVFCVFALFLLFDLCFLLFLFSENSCRFPNFTLSH